MCVIFNLPLGTGMTRETADFGPLRIGSRVIIHRHRPVQGQDNWVSGMNPYDGLQGVVCQFCGVDNSGCPCVKCTFNGSTCTYAFRIRDLTLVLDNSNSNSNSSSFTLYNLPQEIGRSGNASDFGPLRVGSRVIIHKHRSIGGKDNWLSEMDLFVGREGVVCQLSGVDACGCPCAKCTFNGTQARFSFRIRDMTLIDGSPLPNFYNLPQGTHMPRERESFGPLKEGMRVLIHRHREVDGEDNWAEGMNEYVGRVGIVGPSDRFGFDGQNCPVRRGPKFAWSGLRFTSCGRLRRGSPASSPSPRRVISRIRNP